MWDEGKYEAPGLNVALGRNEDAERSELAGDETDEKGTSTPLELSRSPYKEEERSAKLQGRARQQRTLPQTMERKTFDQLTVTGTHGLPLLAPYQILR